MSLAAVENWETKLRAAFDRVDRHLEETYGRRFTCRPGRPADGEGVTRDADGIFDLSVGFTAGFGSAYGEGYVFRVRLATSDPVAPDLQKTIEAEAVGFLSDELEKAFPGRELRIVSEAGHYKIIGDLRL
ncbi:MAG TPA: hypothetical protein PKM25_05240 [Candidatus Ozemobacteraceae bacterium]|nr:hypothetical protein [Candidatus Ozemobacteraceae bacterium]